MDYTKLTLGELLTHTNETIKRNAMSILKTLQKEKQEGKCHHGVSNQHICLTCDIPF